jgi:hypothetical protein
MAPPETGSNSQCVVNQHVSLFRLVQVFPPTTFYESEGRTFESFRARHFLPYIPSYGARARSPFVLLFLTCTEFGPRWSSLITAHAAWWLDLNTSGVPRWNSHAVQVAIATLD